MTPSKSVAVVNSSRSYRRKRNRKCVIVLQERVGVRERVGNDGHLGIDGHLGAPFGPPVLCTREDAAIGEDLGAPLDEGGHVPVLRARVDRKSLVRTQVHVRTVERRPAVRVRVRVAIVALVARAAEFGRAAKATRELSDGRIVARPLRRALVVQGRAARDVRAYRRGARARNIFRPSWGVLSARAPAPAPCSRVGFTPRPA